jgi:hydroxymethylpyrimidine pyrophosphatase-like HAD family hydrolase
MFYLALGGSGFRFSIFESSTSDFAMNIRLLAIDLDGTLLNTRGEVSPKNRSCLREVLGRGVQVAIVTGRRYHSALPFVEQVPGSAVIISSNGAWIGTVSGEALHTNLLPRETARQILAASAGYRGYAAAFFDIPGRGQILMHEDAAPDGPLQWYLKSCPDCVLQVPDLAAEMSRDPLQVTFGGPPSAIEPLDPVLRASPAASRIHLTWTKYLARNLSLLDVMNQTCSKGSALAYWSRRCGILREEVMAIGDNLNDLEMLAFAGRPVLMANHNLDPVPDGWPVTDSNDQDGVAHAIEQYVLRP